MREAVTLGLPRAAFVAHVQPEASVTQQQLYWLCEPVWHSFAHLLEKAMCQTVLYTAFLRPTLPQKSYEDSTF